MISFYRNLAEKKRLNRKDGKIVRQGSRKGAANLPVRNFLKVDYLQIKSGLHYEAILYYL